MDPQLKAWAIADAKARELRKKQQALGPMTVENYFRQKRLLQQITDGEEQ